MGRGSFAAHGKHLRDAFPGGRGAGAPAQERRHHAVERVLQGLRRSSCAAVACPRRVRDAGSALYGHLAAPRVTCRQRRTTAGANGAWARVHTHRIVRVRDATCAGASCVVQVLTPHNTVRPGRPLDLGSAVRVSPRNFLSLETLDKRVHYVAVLVVRDVPRAHLARAILARRGVPIAAAAACAVAAVRGSRVSVSDLRGGRAAGVCADDDDDDVCMASVTLALCDPVAKTPMRIPARGLQCRHVQCFDLLCYLRFQETPSLSSWLCPHCAEVRRVVLLCRL
jgi:hypothetical protein